MEYRMLGRTGLKVSRIGLGAGGQSCLGMKTGKSKAESVKLVERALDLGINLIDTSGRNQTEGIIGRAISRVDRDSVILSTKRTPSDGPHVSSKREFVQKVEDSFRALGTDYIDIMNFHGVLPDEYDYVVGELLPELLKLKDAGAIGHIGITEIFDRDRDHRMLQKAVRDDYWDVMMVGFNLVNQSAGISIFPSTAERNIGVMGMFAVRRALRDRQSLEQALDELKSRSLLPRDFDQVQVLDKLLAGYESSDALANIAYRYCRDTPAVHSVLVGTGEVAHLEANIDTFAQPPLEEGRRSFIADTFGHISDFSGN